MDNQHASLMQDPVFFYGIAFVIFLGLAWKFGRKPLVGWVDAEIIKVRDELERAQALRVEAEAVLAIYQKKQAEATEEAGKIIEQAQRDAQGIKAQAEADLKASLARHEQQALDRIRIAEAEASAHVSQAAITLAMDVARQTLASKIDATVAAKLIDQAIADLPMASSTKAEAA